MTPTDVRDRAAALLVAAADRVDACCARALLAVADDVRAIRLPEAPPPPADQARRRDVIVRSLERHARLLQRGHEVRPVVVALRGIARQVRRLVLAAEPETRTVPPSRPAAAPPSGRPDGRYSFLDAETAIEGPGSRRGRGG
ncbi:hypothetical protein [Sorangium sp. So ce1024]|uniref:hypothetical protein n=1 Tax=Sorangium sp. So ce1024 TaxID=3133327 RepID=UPI003F0F31D5